MKHYYSAGIIFIVCLCVMSSSYAQSIFILLHGTWATETAWHMPGGGFFDALEVSATKQNGCVVSYLWSGKLDHDCREYTAKGLVKLIQSYPVEYRIFLVCHSHGGNIAVLASQLLARDRYNKHSIAAIYNLGTPVHTNNYMPNMAVVGYVYNLFSYKDRVQSVLGFFDREYPKHERIANVRVTINGSEPSHSELHHPLLAQWIPFLHVQLAQEQINGFQFFSASNPGLIHFTQNQPPRYEIDLGRRLISAKHVLYTLIRHKL